MAVLTFLLVGIENIGIQIEQPLAVLPLRALAMGCRTAVDAVTKTSKQDVDALMRVLDIRLATQDDN